MTNADALLGIAGELIADLFAHDQQRPRSRQTSLGMSQVGTCRRQAQYILMGETGSGNSSSIAAIVGTAMHETIQQARAHRGLIQEQAVHLHLADDHILLGHVDEIDVDRRIVRDWKTSTEGKIAEIRESGPQATYVNQVLLYTAACLEMGVLPDDGQDVTMQLVFLDRNGKVPPYVWEQTFDPDDLQVPLDWLHEVEDGIRTGEMLPQDKPVTWCEQWCQFYSICREPDLSPQTFQRLDGEQAQDARTYLEFGKREAQIVAAKAEVKGRLKGVQGVTDDGITVRWTSYDRDPYQVKGGHVTRLDVRGPKK